MEGVRSRGFRRRVLVVAALGCGAGGALGLGACGTSFDASDAADASGTSADGSSVTDGQPAADSASGRDGTVPDSGDDGEDATTVDAAGDDASSDGGADAGDGSLFVCTTSPFFSDSLTVADSTKWITYVQPSSLGDFEYSDAGVFFDITQDPPPNGSDMSLHSRTSAITRGTRGDWEATVNFQGRIPHEFLLILPSANDEITARVTFTFDLPPDAAAYDPADHFTATLSSQMGNMVLGTWAPIASRLQGSHHFEMHIKQQLTNGLSDVVVAMDGVPFETVQSYFQPTNPWDVLLENSLAMPEGMPMDTFSNVNMWTCP